MINYRKNLYSALSSTVTTYSDFAPEEVQAPYCVFTEEERDFDYSHSGIFEGVTVNVTLYHSNRALGAAMLESIISKVNGTALSGLVVICNPAGVDVDAESNIYIFSVNLAIRY